MFEVEYLILAVRNIFRSHDDFERIYTVYFKQNKAPFKRYIINRYFNFSIMVQSVFDNGTVCFR